MKISKPLFITLLVLLNAVPVYGVFNWGWQSFDLIFLYWLENLIIGAFMIFRIVARRYSHPVEAAFPLFLAPFFTFHYGMFCYVHGQFVISLFGKNLGAGLEGMQIPQIIIPLVEARHLLWPVIAFLLSSYWTGSGIPVSAVLAVTILKISPPLPIDALLFCISQSLHPALPWVH